MFDHKFEMHGGEDLAAVYRPKESVRKSSHVIDGAIGFIAGTFGMFHSILY